MLPVRPRVWHRAFVSPVWVDGENRHEDCVWRSRRSRTCRFNRHPGHHHRSRADETMASDRLFRLARCVVHSRCRGFGACFLQTALISCWEVVRWGREGSKSVRGLVDLPGIDAFELARSCLEVLDDRLACGGVRNAFERLHVVVRDDGVWTISLARFGPSAAHWRSRRENSLSRLDFQANHSH